MSFQQMKDEWREEARALLTEKFLLANMEEYDCGGWTENEIASLMVEFAIKKQSERGM